MRQDIRHHPRRATEKSAAELKRDLEFLRAINDRTDKRTKQADAVDKFTNERHLDLGRMFVYIGSGHITMLIIWMTAESFPNVAKWLFWTAIGIVFAVLIIAAFHAAKTNEP